ncbi:aldehyde dehydrogenase family protein [Thermovirga sp.]|uniref:aldehyde dehydrogenase family protein n=1 Tax=Thermovirga sp. TaxID=2699834 RepID=UPI0025F2E8F9|nr:aldehyde dehydrogenase family protein [Thermovirga sp.]MBO8154642.1 aldehyde dehydrogenase EutE [Thermovirga sp.]
MALREQDIKQIVAKVLEELKDQVGSLEKGRTSQASYCYGDVDDAVEMAVKAQKIWQWEYSLEDKKKIVDGLKKFLLDYVEELAVLAVEDTGMGRVDDKIAKNRLAVEKTPGPEFFTTKATSGDNGLVLEELSPFGVIASITPSTNPTASVINNAICMISGGNAVVFAPHPSAVKCSLRSCELINQYLTSQGVPAGLVSSLSIATLENARKLMTHKDVRLVSATGGPGVVKAALSSGKPAIGAGPGNPPVIVDETAHLEKAAKDVIAGCSFDNNLPCIAEKELIVVNCVADQLKRYMLENGAFELKGGDVGKLKKLVLTEDGKPNKDYVGKDAVRILADIGIKVPESVRVILVEAEEQDLLVQEEMLMPVLPMVRVSDFEDGLMMALRVEHGFRHSAAIHSTNIDNMSRMARAMETTIFTKNAPSFASIGFGGDCPTAFTIATTTGQGPTTPLSFCRVRRCLLHGAFRIV